MSSSLEHDRAPTYEGRLAADARWALTEGSKHFEERSAVSQALRKIVARLEELGIAYVIVGDMSLFAHGLRRFTEVVRGRPGADQDLRSPARLPDSARSVRPGQVR